MPWNGSDRKYNGSKQCFPKSKAKQKLVVSYVLLVILIIVSSILAIILARCDSESFNINESNVQTEYVKADKGAVKKRIKQTRKNKPQRKVPQELKSPTSMASSDRGPTNNIPSERVIVNDGTHRPPDRYAILPLNCDKQIAGILYAIPGQLIIGTVDFDDEFEKQFLESIKSTLTVGDDATNEEREMIDAVNEAKKVILDLMKKERKTAGEVLRETRQQLRELGQYKQMLREELQRYESDADKSDVDVSDLFDAANKILKENGIDPFEPNDLTREVVRQYKFDQLEGIQ